ncbi:unnamed protein product, partial [Owenia fusiformis]
MIHLCFQIIILWVMIGMIPISISYQKNKADLRSKKTMIIPSLDPGTAKGSRDQPTGTYEMSETTMNSLQNLHKETKNDDNGIIPPINMEYDSNFNNQIGDFCDCTSLSCKCKATSKKEHWPLETILELLPQNITSLQLDNFDFGILKNNMFKKFKLHVISIRNSNLTGIEVDAFQNLNKMVKTSIDLSSNDIQFIGPGAFKHGNGTSRLNINYNYNLGLQNVENILKDFENRELHDLSMKECGIVIDTLDETFFKPLQTSKLKSLDLSGNTIRSIAYNAFKPIKALTKLWISNFMYISPPTMNILENLQDFRLFGGIQKSTASIPTLDVSGLQHLKHLRLYLSDS